MRPPTRKRPGLAGRGAGTDLKADKISITATGAPHNGGMAALKFLASMMRTDVYWKKTKSGQWCIKEPLTDRILERHLNGGPGAGACPIKAGESTTMVALLDFDSHKGETPWEEMQRIAQVVIAELERRGMKVVVFRSSGGKGIHIYLLWDEPQDAHNVRVFLMDALAACGYRNGTGGIVNGEVEVFPKQDSVPPDGFGNMFILPLAGESVLLEPLLGLEPMDRDCPFEWRISPSVPAVTKESKPPVSSASKEPREPRSDVRPSMGLQELRALVAAIPNEGEHELDYDSYRNAIFAIHFETGGSEEGRKLAHELSARSAKHDPEFLDKNLWRYIKTDRANPITGATLRGMATAVPEDFEDLGAVEEGPGSVTMTVTPANIFSRLIPGKFPEGVLPPEFDQYVVHQAVVTGVDRGMLAMFGIAACNAAISNRFRVKVKRHARWTEPVIIWIGPVGDPSIKKSPALKVMMRPVKAMDKTLRMLEASSRQDYSIEERIYKKRVEDYIREKMAGTAGEKPQPPTRPEIRRAVVKESTVEGLREVLALTSDGTTIVRDELSGWFGGMDAYRGGGVNKDRPHWLEFYNGEPYSFDRVDRNIYIPHWGGSIVGGIQPAPMARIATTLEDDGLLQRFNVFLAADATAGADIPIEEDLERGYENCIQRLFSYIPPGQPLTLSPEARRVREEVATFVHQYHTVGALPERLRTHLGKWEGMFCRYCLILHLIDAAYHGEVFGGEINGDVARRVWRLFMDYFWPHALVFYSEVADRTDIMDGARWVGGYILARKLKAISRRSIQRGYRHVRHDQVLLDAIMGALDTYGWVSPVVPESGYQRVTKQWKVNPQVHELFKDRAQHERENRQREREAVARAVEKFRSDKDAVDNVACAREEGFSKSE